MEARLQQMLLDNGLLLGLLCAIAFIIYKNRFRLLKFLNSTKWRKHLVRSVVYWNDDLLDEKVFRKEIDSFVKLHYEDTQEIRGDMKRQLDTANIAHQVAEKILNSNDAIHRVLVLRMHNGETTLSNSCLFKVSCIAERTERKFSPSAMTRLMQSISIELLAYSIEFLLDSDELQVFLGVFKPELINVESELKMNPANQSFRLKCVDASGLLAILVRGMNGKPLCIIEAHLRYTPTNLAELRTEMARLSTDLMPCL